MESSLLYFWVMEMNINLLHMSNVMFKGNVEYVKNIRTMICLGLLLVSSSKSFPI
jgi:hypothetical protein